MSHGPGHSPAPGSNRVRSCSKGKMFTPTDFRRRKRQRLGWRPDTQPGSPSCPEPGSENAPGLPRGARRHVGRGGTWDEAAHGTHCPRTHLRRPRAQPHPGTRSPQLVSPRPPQHPQLLHLVLSPSPKARPARTPALGACDPRALPAARPAPSQPSRTTQPQYLLARGLRARGGGPQCPQCPAAARFR